MIYDIVKRLEKVDAIENIALNLHTPDKKAKYVIVNKEEYKVVSHGKFCYNSKYVVLDYFSNIISSNKAVDKFKKISSNNPYSFFCKDTDKLTEEIIKNYFNGKNPKFMRFVLDNYKKLSKDKDKNHKLKIFYIADPEKTIEEGREYFLKRSMTLVKPKDEFGAGPFVNVNFKKPYSLFMGAAPAKETMISAYKQKCLKDILKSLIKRKYCYVYFLENGKFLAYKEGEVPDQGLTSAIFVAIKLNSKGDVDIWNLDMISNYSPQLKNTNYVSLAEYAKINELSPDTVRQKVLRGGYKTAKKNGRNWVIDKNEPNIDGRRK